MSELFNWIITIAYFALFLVGLVTCFKEAQSAWLSRRLDCISIYEKRNYLLKGVLNAMTAFFGILGLIQAFVGI